MLENLDSNSKMPADKIIPAIVTLNMNTMATLQVLQKQLIELNASIKNESLSAIAKSVGEDNASTLEEIRMSLYSKFGE